jgi:hypothetical protein
MKINWKRIVIAAIWSELLLFAIYFLAVRYVAPVNGIAIGGTIILLNWFGMPFLGGLWVTRKIKSRFVLHGVLVGIVISILFFPLMPIAYGQQAITFHVWIAILLLDALKILGSTLGAYVGGMRRKILLSAQTAKSPN